MWTTYRGESPKEDKTPGRCIKAQWVWEKRERAKREKCSWGGGGQILKPSQLHQKEGKKRELYQKSINENEMR